MSSVRFGLSTHLYHADRLDREHLVEIAAHDFEAVEVFATRTHFDYRDPNAVAALAEWLDDTRLTLHSVHAPICASLVDGAWGEMYSTATAEDGRRRRALTETEAALNVARTIPYPFLVVHLGVPGAEAPGDNNRDAARRSLEELQRMAEAVNVRLALEVIPNPLSAATTLVRLIEEELETPNLGICLDIGHARLMGDPIDAIEACSGHLVTTHLHDNQGRTDDHLVPFEGSIDWEAALLALQKVGYDGAWMFEVANTGSTGAVLDRTSRARRRFEELLDQGLPDGWSTDDADI